VLDAGLDTIASCAERVKGDGADGRCYCEDVGMVRREVDVEDAESGGLGFNDLTTVL